LDSVIKQGRGQKAGGFYECPLPLPVTEGNKGLIPQLLQVAPLRDGVESPSLKEHKALCLLPPAFFKHFWFFQLAFTEGGVASFTFCAYSRFIASARRRVLPRLSGLRLATINIAIAFD
jgi:hypothetical protein